MVSDSWWEVRNASVRRNSCKRSRIWKRRTEGWFKRSCFLGYLYSHGDTFSLWQSCTPVHYIWDDAVTLGTSVLSEQGRPQPFLIFMLSSLCQWFYPTDSAPLRVAIFHLQLVLVGLVAWFSWCVTALSSAEADGLREVYCLLWYTHQKLHWAMKFLMYFATSLHTTKINN